MRDFASKTQEPDHRFSPFHPRTPSAGETVLWRRLQGDSLALAVANAASRSTSPVLVITADSRQAEQLKSNIEFFMAGDGIALLPFPDWETLPYDVYSPHPDIVSRRLETLYTLPRAGRTLTLAPVATLMQRLTPRAYVDARSLILRTGQFLDQESTIRGLEESGYQRVPQVMEHGEFAVRGSIIDLFPMGSAVPLRVDLLDSQIESIRTFDPETQRSVKKVSDLRLLPGREYPFDAEGIKRFRGAFRAAFSGNPQNRLIYTNVSRGITPGGLEYYLPLFHDSLSSIFDYLPPDTLIIALQDVETQADGYWTQITERYRQRVDDPDRPPLEPATLYIEPDEFRQRLIPYPRITVEAISDTATSAPVGTFAISALPEITLRPRMADPAAALKRFFQSYAGRVLFIAETPGHRESLIKQLGGYDLRPAVVGNWGEFLESTGPVCITVGPLQHGFVMTDPDLALIPESELFGHRARQQRRRRRGRDPESLIRNLSDLSVGAPVVHEEHGVGRYRGLQKLAAGGIEAEFLTLEYAGGDKLYVPVTALNSVSRYIGAGDAETPLHRLGSEQWRKIRSRAAQKIRDVAAELLEIYARRAARKGTTFELDGHDYTAFSSAFPFEETPDQESSIDAVIDDMKSTRPMDRVVCGDVGFGKTEVAMRAAFVAAENGFQTAILVPTTLLAQQHYQTFSDRFADWPIRVEAISRFQSKKEMETLTGDVESGAIDIVIGTHRLLQKDIKFKKLGLVIIDEEHRFGVRQKERLKALRTEVDLLTLTATPIPRTMNMSLSGLRDLSIIATPPPHRFAVHTFIGPWHGATIREACLREIKRGGQIYFVHNKVETIERAAERIKALVPEISLRIAHGKMRERELEEVMLDFYHQRFQMLVCTTIIESGIDVPTANTIVIDRADCFGLAQLHQLRGRVGRSHHRAYAYLITPDEAVMSPDAVKRLQALESLEDLGAGFTLAAHDLEIRGAGELLGEEQSGQIQEIGYSLYTDLLNRTIAALREGRTIDISQPISQGPEIELRIPAMITDTYIPDVHTRLTLYKRIAGAGTERDLDDIQIEMIDRFGLLPEATKNLFRIASLKNAAAGLGINRIEASDREGKISFTPETRVRPERIIQLLENDPNRYTMSGGDKLRFTANMPEPPERFGEIESILKTLNEGPLEKSCL